MKKQQELNLYLGRRGGPRSKAGRPRIHSPGVSHTSRPKINDKIPLHINFKYNAFIRTQQVLLLLKRAIQNASSHGLLITHFTLQSNHIHLIAEARDTPTLTKGMRSLTVTMIRSLPKNKMQIERYHLHVLKTKGEVQNAVSYVLNNDLKHGQPKNKQFTKELSPGKSWLLNSIKK